MNNQLVPFHFNTAAVRVITDENGEPWFCAKDICNILGYGNDSAALAKHCREAGVTKRDLRSGGQDRSFTFINEGNVFRLIVRSKKPAAEQFESWLFEEVLPSIRKTGAYGVLPDAVRPGQVEALQLARLQDIALRSIPEWSKLSRYYELELTQGEMGRLMGWKPHTVRETLREMAACGLVNYRTNPLLAAAGRKGAAISRQRQLALQGGAA